MPRTDLLTVPQAAQALGVSRKRVDDYIRAGELPVEWYGPVRMVRADDLRALPPRKPGRPWPPRADRPTTAKPPADR